MSIAEGTMQRSRLPKLRSSCDHCGMSKVKCDRGQPECGRCISHGLPCIYGISQKKGKPPLRPSLSQPKNNNPITSRQSGDSSCGDDMSLGIGLSLSSTSIAHAQDPLDHDNHHDIIFDFLNAGEGLGGEFLMPFVPNYTVDSSEWGVADQSDISIHSPPLRSVLSSEQPEHHSSIGSCQFTGNEGTHRERGSIPHRIVSSHDCLSKSYEILKRLSILNSSQADCGTSPPTTPTITAEIPSRQVPLDRVLQLSREATESLIPLAACSCARLPHVALLYTSIISRILAWYHQAAACPHTISQSNPNTVAQGAFTPSASGESTPAPSIQSPGITVAPSRMAIGTFNVDDLHLQSAMKMHLLSAEMKRVKGLIDLLGSQTNSSDSTSDDIGSLFQSLNSWLQWDHSRLLDMMQSELRELNI